MIKVIVCGACGKIGKQLIGLISQDEEMKLMFAIEEKTHSRINKTISVGDIVLTHDLEKIINETDVVIDFSDYRETGLKHLMTAADRKKAIIIGTANLENSFLPEINLIKHFIREVGKVPCVIILPIMTSNGIPANPSCQCDIFIRDAIKAIKWIVGKPTGLYDMRDVSAAECFRN